MQTGDAPPPGAHFCIAVDRPRRPARPDRAAGVKAPTPTEIVGRPRFMCRDPFGNLVS